MKNISISFLDFPFAFNKNIFIWKFEKRGLRLLLFNVRLEKGAGVKEQRQGNIRICKLRAENQRGIATQGEVDIEYPFRPGELLPSVVDHPISSDL